jgi:hypothetical protein
MSMLLAVALCLVGFSYVSARDRGVPWFSLGTSLSKPMPGKYHRLRTRNIQPQSSEFLSLRRIPSRATAGPLKKEPFPAEAFHTLVVLTHDKGAAMRLIQDVKVRNPARSTLWCVEKAIYDIERDRMAR